ncbi:hypothetical protein Nepgr_033539 [Nepenthes gracilis]|uniref:Uncharacterized protein n=1 Tax=Nepenthes gracilis TaxID=150966 RepID=A0AAD3Y8G5_NEPGR|nr:hypothetical protein Nepgr_033539 [Nepenthes gracilis]
MLGMCPVWMFGSLSLVLLGTLFWSFSVKVGELLAIGRLSTCYSFTECLDPSDMMAVKCWCCMCSSIVGLCRDVVGQSIDASIIKYWAPLSRSLLEDCI